jgi:hypothetical protein
MPAARKQGDAKEGEMADRIISAWVYNPENNLFGDKGGKAAIYRISCQNPDGCDVFTKQGSCLLTGILACKFGRKSRIDGPTRRARNFRSWMEDQRRENAEYIGRLTSLKAWNRIALINGYYYLPYSHMDSGWFRTDQSPLKSQWVLKEDLGAELLERLCAHVPYGLAGAIASYQRDIVPKFIADLRMFYPELYDLLPEGQKARLISFVGRQADLTTCLPGKYTIGTNAWDWDGKVLSGGSMLFQPAPGVCLITITPDKGSPVKITSDSQIGPETVFLD